MLPATAPSDDVELLTPEDAHVAFNLGWDRAFYGLVCGTEDPAVRNGYQAGLERCRGRTRKPSADRFVRKWLQLRLNAWTRGRVFDEAVTPEYLRSIDRSHCPITGVALTHGSREGSDWSVDRIHNDGAYARGNLVVMSTRANRVKSNLTFAEVLERVKTETGPDGLSPLEWARLASLMEGPAAAAGETLPLVPLLLASLHGVSATLSQVLQAALAREAFGQGRVPVVRAIRKTCLAPADRAGFDGVLKRLRKRASARVRLSDVWAHGNLFGHFGRWFTALQPSSRQRITQLLAERAAVQSEAGDIARWHLGERGYYEDPVRKAAEASAARAEAEDDAALAAAALEDLALADAAAARHVAVEAFYAASCAA